MRTAAAAADDGTSNCLQTESLPPSGAVSSTLGNIVSLFGLLLNGQIRIADQLT